MGQFFIVDTSSTTFKFMIKRLSVSTRWITASFQSSFLYWKMAWSRRKTSLSRILRIIRKISSFLYKMNSTQDNTKIVIRETICTSASTEHCTNHICISAFAAHTTCYSFTLTFDKFSTFFTGLPICNPDRFPWYVSVIWSFPAELFGTVHGTVHVHRTIIKYHLKQWNPFGILKDQQSLCKLSFGSFLRGYIC